jgi:hypothetical protein
MAYDSRRHVVVLFGGADAEAVRGDTWEWNGRTWKRVSDHGPSPRTFPAMTYDGERGVTLVFGGNTVLFGKENSNPKLLDDFWEWDGTQWKQLPSGPSARAEAVLAFDPVRRRVVLFGGYERVSGERRPLGDTWEWNGTRWTIASKTGPSPRNGAAIAHDFGRGRTVLFGGPPVTGAGFETWEWDGERWLRSTAVSAEGRFNAVMAYDEIRRRVVRFGGWNGQQRMGDTWEYDGVRWTRLSQTGPHPRNHAALVYDSHCKCAVLFGGHDGESVFGDLWEWNGKRWSQRISTKPQKRIENGH